jgi:3-hydroxyacyl-CoA dehydrogenase
MSELVKYSTRDGVAIITVDNPPVNALSTGVPAGILSALEAAETDPAIHAIVLAAAGRTFIAGADINDFLNVVAGKADLPELHPLLYALEDSPKPVVAAIHGMALGGGMEVAMACHYRVALPDAQVGQPETKLGIIPGAGGTQRLPRLIGPLKAAELCAMGDPIPAPEALQLGALDRLIEGDLVAGAVAFAITVAGKPGPKTRQLNDKLGSVGQFSAEFAALRQQVKAAKRNLHAPQAAIEAVESSTTLSFGEGIQKESVLFKECLASTEARALIHAFFGDRAVAKIPDVPKDTRTFPIRAVAIIGAGTMGGGIAMAFANVGIPVRIKDTQEALDRCLANARRNYENSVKRGRYTREVMEQRLSLIAPQTTYEGFDHADMVIEAAFESMPLKQQIFGELDKIAKPDCILATNTSSLDINAIAVSTLRPHMVIGLHFFSPANAMRLVEIVRGDLTGKEVIATAMAVAKTLKKVGVLVRNGFGFVGNRMMFPYMYEAQFVAEEGSTPEEVDKALTRFGMAMGIFSVDDLGGLDVAARIREEQHQFSKPGLRKPLASDKLVALGRLGQKTGKGWYLYDDNRKQTPDAEVVDLIRKTAGEAAIPQRSFTEEEIVERTMYGLINEGARVLEDGTALRAVDIDVIYLNGYGFPAYRGGPMFYADTVGLKKIYDKICEFHEQHGARWEPAPLLKRLAEEGRTFASFDAERVAHA